MGKTIQVAADRAHDETKAVVPAEVARGIYIENPPSAQALKLLLLLIQRAGARMADEMQHETRMADLKHLPGIRNLDRASLRALFVQLRAAVMVYDDIAAQEEIIGGFMDEIRVAYGDEAAGFVVRWWFGRTFRRVAAESNHWAILDRQTVFALTSKYSILLFQHIASLVNLAHVSSRTFTVAELRAVLGIDAGKIKRFANLKSDVLEPTIAEINDLSRFTLTATPKKIGRAVARVEISWTEKLDPGPAKVAARRAGSVEHVEPQPRAEFPETGGIAYSPRWRDLKRAAGCGRDNLLVGSDFRAFLKEQGIRRDAPQIEAVFSDWCHGLARSGG